MAYAVFAFWVVMSIGWIANLVKLCGMDDATGMLVARAIGIVIAPLGSFLGFF